MTDWNPRLPESWAQLLGLVSVPMFGAARSRLEQGTHAMMLDGDTSFVWSIADEPASPVFDATANRWSWSSNVRWSVALNRAATNATIRRWDSPKVEHLPSITKDDARAIFDSFRGQAPPTSQTVIQRGLLTFRAIRQAIENKGGNELDVVLAFNTVLALAGSSASNNHNFSDAVHYLHSNGELGFSEEKVKPSLKRFPMGDLTQLLLEGASPTGFLLDADLLIRHASGTLYQEAHKQLTDGPWAESQQKLPLPEFLLLGPDRNRGRAPSDIHHTPPSLARALSEIALRFVKRPEGRSLI